MVRYLSRIHNWILWRCWSERLLFKLRQLDDRTTDVAVFAIPAAFRITIPDDETVCDPEGLLSKLTFLSRETSR